MAVEAKRGCGYRKVGGLYLVGGGIGVPCDRLPFELTVCSCCGQGIKQGMGWTWIDVAKFFQGSHYVPKDAETEMPCPDWYQYKELCQLCFNPMGMGRAGLLWIGEKFYKKPSDFVNEGVELGFSRRIRTIPHGFKVGETWVMLAHAKAVGTQVSPTQAIHTPGIFYCWMPQRVEKIMKESQRNTEEVENLEKRGITPVFVPDDDPDHQGNVHADFEREQREKKEGAE